MSAQRRIFADARQASIACGGYILELLAARLEAAPIATLAVSGGSTPKIMFEEMARSGFDFSRVHFFWVDERSVAPTDPASNYGMTRAAILDPASIPAANVHRILGELPAAEAAAHYASLLREFFQLNDGALPVFDVIHRGMGGEGHTASLFPGDPWTLDAANLTAAVNVPKPPNLRVTLLPGVLAAARHTVMLTAGADKAEAVRAVFETPYEPLRVPAQIGTVAGPNAVWFLDTAASALLTLV